MALFALALYLEVLLYRLMPDPAGVARRTDAFVCNLGRRAQTSLHHMIVLEVVPCRKLIEPDSCILVTDVLVGIDLGLHVA